MRDWKTTLAGLFAAAGYLLPLFGVPVETTHIISACGVAAMGILGKDAEGNK